MIPAYPLCWPDFLPRKTGWRESGRFKTTLAAALKNVQASIRLFGSDSGKPVRDIVLSSNCTLGVEKPSDPGVAAWFTWDGEQVCIPVDRYDTPASNLQAIHHIIEARRVELRHGSLALVKASFRGFKALPDPNKRSWRDVLGFHDAAPGTVTADMIKLRYRERASTAHPDKGGSADEMARLTAARDEALRAVGAA